MSALPKWIGDQPMFGNVPCFVCSPGNPCRDHVGGPPRDAAPRPTAPVSGVDELYQRRVRGEITRITDKLGDTASGARHDQLINTANYCFKLANGAGIDNGWVRAQLEYACERNGYTQGHPGQTERDINDCENNVGTDVQYLDDRPNQNTMPPAHTLTDQNGQPITEHHGENPHPAAADDDSGPPALTARLLNRTALKSLPDPEPLITNTLDQGTVALLYGKWGTYKSFIALDWAASVSTARPWQGRPTERRRALYVAAEGAFGFKTRVAAWETGWNTTITDDDLSILPCPINLTNRAEVAALAAVIDWGGYGFIVIDTLARCMVGADENSAKDGGVVIDALTRLRERTPGGRGVILGVHHTGKDGKTLRGTTAFEAGADTVYAVKADGGAINLDREKRKDGPEADHHELRLDLIEGTGSGVISVHRGVDINDRANKLLSTFVHHFGATGATKAEMRNVADMPGATFHRAVNDLLKSGDLVNTGTEKRPFYQGASK